MARLWLGWLVAGALCAGAPAASAADGAIAEVAALSGVAVVGGRPLEVGDAIAPGATIETDAGGRVGVFASDIYVQLDPSSALTLERGADGRVLASLARGRARVIDTRGAGGSDSLRVDRTRAAIAGGDSEIYVLSEKAGRYAMFCEWTGPLTVTRDPGSVRAQPGQCVLSKPGEPLYTANGHEHQIPLLPLPADVALDSPANHFSTEDVAAGPPGFGGPLDPALRDRDPCDVPGSACSLALRVVEPAPDPDTCAPGVICGD